MDDLKPTAWTWSPDWSLYGDSMAGVLSRLAYANVLRVNELKELASSSAHVSLVGNPMYQSSRSEREWRQIAAVTGLTEGEQKKALLGDFLEALRWTRIASRRLRYCPECMGSGYHARYFQIEALANCPIHQVALRDQCPVCHAQTPFYGLCGELFGDAGCCHQCGASFSKQPVSLRKYFHPELPVARLKEIWHPLDDWLRQVERSNLDFSALRTWASEYGGLYATERQIDAMHVVGCVVPLPRGRFTWKPPLIRRKAFYFSGKQDEARGGRFQENYIEDAYLDIRRHVERKLSEPRLTELLASCKRDSWGVIRSDRPPEELAYVIWRVKLEHVTDPVLIANTRGQAGVFMNGAEFSIPFWTLSRAGWKILFLAMYRGYVSGVAWCQRENQPIDALLQCFPLYQCCILPSTDMRGGGRGIIAYPMPTEASARRTVVDD